MFVIFEKGKNLHPIKVWLENISQLDDICLEQATNLSNLPFIHRWVSLMPDTHAGMGMPIGGVIATEGVIIPNAVGVDIGCGMAFVQTNIRAKDLTDTITGSGTLLQAIIGDILRNIPVGFGRHKKRQECTTLDQAIENLESYHFAPELIPEIEAGYNQVGTLGGGNHFIELQEDEDGFVGIMLHSGSRHFGLKICNYFNTMARAINARYHSSVPDDYRLAFLPVESDAGRAYINWMNLALGFAYENRDRMMTAVMDILTNRAQKYLDITPEYTSRINAHHNYSAIEHHFGKNVWVHRKGAIRAREGELGIIPGAMGSYSYIVQGLQNDDSFHSCSHGAGRLMSRRKAMDSFTTEEVMLDLKKHNVVLGKNSKADVAEESRFAYKDIDYVISQELDLVTPVKKLRTLGVVKG